MKWNKHQTNSRYDAKIKKLTRKYGMEGFGVYWFIVESIAEKLDENLDCILEYDLEDLATDMNIKVQKLTIVMDFCVEIGLFTKKSSKYQCLKLLKYMDEWTKKQVKLQSNSVVTPEQLRSKEEKEGEEKERSEVKPLKTNYTLAVKPVLNVNQEQRPFNSLNDTSNPEETAKLKQLNDELLEKQAKESFNKRFNKPKTLAESL